MQEIKVDFNVLNEISIWIRNDFPLDSAWLFRHTDIFGQSSGIVADESKRLISALDEAEEVLSRLNLKMGTSISKIAQSFKRQEELNSIIISSLRPVIK